MPELHIPCFVQAHERPAPFCMEIEEKQMGSGVRRKRQEERKKDKVLVCKINEKMLFK